MTKYYQLRKAYKNRELIEVCVPCLISYQMGDEKTVQHKVDGAWFGYIPPFTHYNYDKKICPEHQIERIEFVLGEAKLHISNLEMRVRQMEKTKVS